MQENVKINYLLNKSAGINYSMKVNKNDHLLNSNTL